MKNQSLEVGNILYKFGIILKKVIAYLNFVKQKLQLFGYTDQYTNDNFYNSFDILENLIENKD